MRVVYLNVSYVDSSNDGFFKECLSNRESATIETSFWKELHIRFNKNYLKMVPLWYAHVFKNPAQT
jgi:hypothetical protein